LISIVICSVDPQRLSNVRRNIADTIGVDYEIIAIDNRVRNLGLCQAYNEGAENSRFDCICFLHEDIEFISQDWGVTLLRHFQNDPSLGLVGLAGSRYKSSKPSGWSDGWGEDICINIWHGQPDAMEQTLVKPKQFTEDNLVSVVALDGVFLCSPRAVWSKVRFSDQLTGFHYYDVDYSLRVAQKYSVAVAYDIPLLHFSLGNFGREWASQALLYAKSSSVPLPAHVLGSVSANGVRLRERATVRCWLKLLRKKKLPFSLRFKWLRNSGFGSFPGLWWLAFKFLFIRKK